MSAVVLRAGHPPEGLEDEAIGATLRVTFRNHSASTCYIVTTSGTPSLSI
ncbi:hypothetical protein AB0I91_07750 [Actinosynnema sp. NPDC049800]